MSKYINISATANVGLLTLDASSVCGVFRFAFLDSVNDDALNAIGS